MDEIRDIFASIEGAAPGKPFASFTGAAGAEGKLAAVAAGRLGPPDGRHYVGYLEKPGAPSLGAANGPAPRYVDEDLALHVGEAASATASSASPFVVRYLEAFEDPFKAGERYNFFWESLHPTPAEDGTDGEIERDRSRGLARIEDFISRRARRSFFDELLRAEEGAEAAAGRGDAEQEEEAFWEQARRTALAELERLIPDPDELEKDLRFHRFRRAASGAGSPEGPEGA